MNKTIMTNDEWAVGFMEQLDSMLDGIESITEKSRASFIIRKTKCFDFWERNVLFPKTKRSFFRTPTLPFSA